MKEKKIVIIDYGLGNLFSVKQACDYFGYNTIVTSDSKDLINADGVILPGVGAFGEAMRNLNSLDLVNPILDFANSGKPFLGVCLGMQLLFSESEEFGNFKGLGIIEGVVKKFYQDLSKDDKLKVPHIGWTKVSRNITSSKSWKKSPLRDLEDGAFMYFVHSFYGVPQEDEDILSKSHYGGLEFCSSVIKENICATQFHPEKSGVEGISIYKNWLLTV